MIFLQKAVVCVEGCTLDVEKFSVSHFQKKPVCCFQGVDEAYDAQVFNYFVSYHQLIDTVSRLAINISSFTQPLINLGRCCFC